MILTPVCLTTSQYFSKRVLYSPGVLQLCLRSSCKEGTGGEGDEGETNSVKLWVPEDHFNQNIYAFISFINGGSVEKFYCANGWNMLEATGLLDTDI